jgi:regulator of sirC expression with transglutaminase-like and TPR domain
MSAERVASIRRRSLWLGAHEFSRRGALALLAVTLVGLSFPSRAAGKAVAGSTSSPSAVEREWKVLLAAKDSEIDLALANWLVASEIPEFRNLSRADYFKQVDSLTQQVRQHMARMEKVAVARGESLTNAHTRCAIFCNAILKLGFTYAEEFRQEKVTAELLQKLYADPDNISLAGLLRTKRGSCVSMPLVYLVIGQRLRMPVHLVAVGKHYFIRWEEPGYRMNIEPTIVTKVAATPEDSVYLETEGLTREQLKGSDLRNLTNREVLGNLLFVRSAYWATREPEHAAQQRRDLELARQLAPDDAGIAMSYSTVFGQAGISPGMPPVGRDSAEKKGSSI